MSLDRCNPDKFSQFHHKSSRLELKRRVHTFLVCTRTPTVGRWLSLEEEGWWVVVLGVSGQLLALEIFSVVG